MKQATIILATFALVTAAAILACNSSRRPSANTEGLVASASLHDSLVVRGVAPAPRSLQEVAKR